MRFEGEPELCPSQNDKYDRIRMCLVSQFYCVWLLFYNTLSEQGKRKKIK